MQQVGLLARIAVISGSAMPRLVIELVTNSAATMGERASSGRRRSWAATWRCTSPPSTMVLPPAAAMAHRAGARGRAGSRPSRRCRCAAPGPAPPRRPDSAGCPGRAASRPACSAPGPRPASVPALRRIRCAPGRRVPRSRSRSSGRRRAPCRRRHARCRVLAAVQRPQLGQPPPAVAVVDAHGRAVRRHRRRHRQVLEPGPIGRARGAGRRPCPARSGWRRRRSRSRPRGRPRSGSRDAPHARRAGRRRACRWRGARGRRPASAAPGLRAGAPGGAGCSIRRCSRRRRARHRARAAISRCAAYQPCS